MCDPDVDDAASRRIVVLRSVGRESRCCRTLDGPQLECVGGFIMLRVGMLCLGDLLSCLFKDLCVFMYCTLSLGFSSQRWKVS